MKKSGFLLIETLIYLVISSIFFLLLFQFTANTYIKYRSSCFSNSHYSCIYGAMDLISRDIQRASSKYETWKKKEKNNLIFSVNHQDKNIDIGWNVQENNLYRIEGEYNEINNSWKNQIKSLVLTKINSFDVAFNKPIYLHCANNTKNIISLVSVIFEVNIKNKIIKIQKSINPRTGLLTL